MPKEGELFQVAPKVDRLWTDIQGGTGNLKARIHGPLPNKSNSRKLVMVKGRPLFIKSKEARDYEEQFRIAVLSSNLPPQFHFEHDRIFLRVMVYQENMRRDLDCELLPDLLQKNGIIKNDRQIYRKEYTRRIDRDNPRIEFQLGIWRDDDADRRLS